MIAKFDPIMAEHLRKISSNEHDHYLGPNMQNELISIMAKEIRKKIIIRMKKNKYHNIQLDCTLDKSHKEQLTLILRIVEVLDNNKSSIREYIRFIHVTSTTGISLTNELKSQLKELGLDLKDCRGQAYDNGANMIGQYKGVQSRII